MWNENRIKTQQKQTLLEHKNNKEPFLLLQVFSNHTNIFVSRMKRMRPFSQVVICKIVNRKIVKIKSHSDSEQKCHLANNLFLDQNGLITEDDSQQTSLPVCPTVLVEVKLQLSGMTCNNQIISCNKMPVQCYCCEGYSCVHCRPETLFLSPSNVSKQEWHLVKRAEVTSPLESAKDDFCHCSTKKIANILLYKKATPSCAFLNIIYFLKKHESIEN